MTAHTLLGAYAAIGLVAAAFTLLRPLRTDRMGRPASAVLALALWPFLLPFLLNGTGGAAREADRLSLVANRLAEEWNRSGRSGLRAADGRERRVLDGFIDRLRADQVRLAELDSALDGAPESIRARLAELRDETRRELDEGVQLVEELAAQLVLLAFTDLQRPDSARLERTHVEALVARIEALAGAQATQ